MILMFTFIRTYVSLCILIVMILVTAISVVYISHLVNTRFAILQNLEQERNLLDEEWGRLLLEESTQTRLWLIEQQAYSRLDMVMPVNDMLVIVSP